MVCYITTSVASWKWVKPVFCGFAIWQGDAVSVTLSQIAEIADVSTITASRALRGVGRVNPETRRRIHKIAVEMGYPSLSGVIFAPRIRKPTLDHPLRILFAYFSNQDVVPSDPHSQRMIVGLNQCLEHRGGRVDVRAFSSFDEFAARWIGLRCQGIVIRQPLPRPWLRQMANLAPLVCTSAHDHHTGVDAIFVNENRAAGIVFERLYSAGHRRIVWLGIDDLYAPFRNLAETTPDATLLDFAAASNHQVRFGAWHALLGNHARTDNLKDQPILIVQRDWRHQSLDDAVALAVQQLFARSQRPTAIVAASDLLGLALIAALRKHGVEVPRDMSVIGYGADTETCATPPLLTSVDEPHQAMGQAIPELIERRIADPHAIPVSIQLEPSLFAGGSVASPPTSDLSDRG